MPTITDDPKTSVKEPIQPARTPQIAAWPLAGNALPQYRPMFSDSLLENGRGEKKQRARTTVFSFGLQCVLLGILVIVPLWFVEDLPKAQLLTFLAAPPPPPPPPPPAAPTVRVVRETDVLESGGLRTPTRIPKKVELIKEEEAPPPAPTGGVVGGIPGGVPGGQTGGVIGSILSATPVVAPRIEPPKRIRVSQGVTQGLLLHKVEPAYPKIALAARVTGVVQVKAVIGKDGVIRELEVISGHPLLVPAALDAVKQWRYRPYLLNGEAVEVETNITVTFQISS